MRRRILKAAGVVVVAYLIAALIVNQFSPHSTGPTSSSYASADSGLAAYATLLTRAGHPVVRLRRTPAHAQLRPNQTLVLLDPEVIVPSDITALRRFVFAGGRLIAGGQAPGAWLSELLSQAPTWAAQASQSATTLIPVSLTAGVGDVESDGHGAWIDPRGTLPILGEPARALVTVASLGSGLVVLVADSSPLQNHLLASADNAALGLSLAGPADRPVVFDEGVHGYGQSSGLAALPTRWKWALIGLIVAALLIVAARFRRLGPLQRPAPQPLPARRAHVEAIAAALERTGDARSAAGPVREHARSLVARRAALPPGAGARELGEAAIRLGLDSEEAGALTAEDVGADRLLAAGSALAKLSGAGR
jgi:Domain of unknown function (DUF4350)